MGLVIEPAFPAQGVGATPRRQTKCSPERDRGSHRQHAADPAAARVGADRLHDPRQGRVHEPRPVGQGPRGAVHHPGRRERGPAAAGRRRSSKARPATPASASRSSATRSAIAPSSSSRRRRARRRRTRCACRRRADRSAGRALREPQQLREGLRPPRRAAGANASRTARSGPTSSTTSPTGRATSRPPARKSGSRRTARSTASSARSAPAARSPASAWRSRSATRRSRIGLADPLGAALYNYYKHGELKAEGSSITEGIGQGRDHREPRRRARRWRFRIPDEEAMPVVFDLLEHEGLCLGGSSGINVAGAIRLARAARPGPHHRDDARATTARATSRSCSIRSSCARRTCPCRHGSSGKAASTGARLRFKARPPRTSGRCRRTRRTRPPCRREIARCQPWEFRPPCRSPCCAKRRCR